jgi:hypothetical protein
MIVSVELPDSIAQSLHLDGEQGSRRALEMMVLEGYRSGGLSRGQVSELLGQTVWETESFLKDHGCGLGMSLDAFDRSTERARAFLAR